ncbi:MAG: N-methyl-L-tryptophan oxidase [Acidobacteria bacterium]|nr:MAG: N-methyl-L-tryptophan oxidase [Acidobacteriota bacterium]
MGHFDAVVVGMGGMGSATAYQLARRGLKVLGLEKHNLLHDMGSSHGLTRIIRLAYYEHPSYVPLLFRAYELWRELENLTGERVLFVTGGIDAGSENGRIVQGSLAACREHSLHHEVLDASRLHERFPGICLSKDMVGVYSPESGFVLSERAIALYTRLALDHGAEVHGREPVTGWEVHRDSVIVSTGTSTYSAGRLIVSAGAWTSKLIPSLSKILQPERQVLIWTRPLRSEIFQLGAFPIFNLQSPEGHFYGFPVHDFPGFKMGRYHHRNEKVDPDAMDRECHPEDEAVLREGIARYFPEANGPTLALKTCLFTNTPLTV